MNLRVYYNNYIDEIGNTFHWSFMLGSVEGLIDLCDTTPAARFDAPGSDLSNPPNPGGEWEVTFGEEKCMYRNNGNGAGSLQCPGMENPRNCEGNLDTEEHSCIGLWGDYFREVARCWW